MYFFMLINIVVQNYVFPPNNTIQQHGFYIKACLNFSETGSNSVSLPTERATSIHSSNGKASFCFLFPPLDKKLQKATFHKRKLKKL